MSGWSFGVERNPCGEKVGEKCWRDKDGGSGERPLLEGERGQRCLAKETEKGTVTIPREERGINH